MFGDGTNRNLSTPSLNEAIKRMKDEENLSIMKIKSANNYSLALMSDGNLYGWGTNENGQLGLRLEIGID